MECSNFSILAPYEIAHVDFIVIVCYLDLFLICLKLKEILAATYSEECPLHYFFFLYIFFDHIKM